MNQKSQIQALDRGQPLLPMHTGQVERRPHDYNCHGTTTLFAALDAATGVMIGRCYPGHRPNEFRKFLNRIERADLAVHLVTDDHASHKTKPIRIGLAKWPGWKVHFTAAGTPWTN
jgi:hypothetical protein